MTDDLDLHDVARVLVDDPPHRAPSLDDLTARVDRRRRHRARLIGLVSVVAVVLVIATVFSLPRSTELQVGGEGTPTAPTTQAPPPFEAGPIQAIVTPESAPFDAARTVELRNTGPEPYQPCRLYLFDLLRWDGASWQPAAQISLDRVPALLLPVGTSETYSACFAESLEPGASTVLSFGPGLAAWPSNDGTAPPTEDDLAAGWYELRETSHPSPSDDRGRSVGRFEITGRGTSEVTDPEPSTATTVGGIATVTTMPGQPSETVGGISVESTIDVWPGEPLTPTGDRLPDQVVVVDDHTVAMTWTGGCTEPADHVDVRMTADEVELRLHLGGSRGECDEGAIAPWVLTFDLGGGIGDRRVVARAGTGTTEVVAPTWDHPDDADPWYTDGRSGPVTPFSYQLVNQPDVDGQFEALYPPPLVASGLWCDLYSFRANGLEVLRARVEPSANPDVTNGCGGGHVIAPQAGSTVFGAPAPRAARQP